MYLSVTVFTLFEPITAEWRLFYLFDALVRGNLCTQWHKILSR